MTPRTHSVEETDKRCITLRNLTKIFATLAAPKCREWSLGADSPRDEDECCSKYLHNRMDASAWHAALKRHLPGLYSIELASSFSSRTVLTALTTPEHLELTLLHFLGADAHCFTRRFDAVGLEALYSATGFSGTRDSFAGSLVLSLGGPLGDAGKKPQRIATTAGAASQVVGNDTWVPSPGETFADVELTLRTPAGTSFPLTVRFTGKGEAVGEAHAPAFRALRALLAVSCSATAEGVLGGEHAGAAVQSPRLKRKAAEAYERAEEPEPEPSGAAGATAATASSTSAGAPARFVGGSASAPSTTGAGLFRGSGVRRR